MTFEHLVPFIEIVIGINTLSTLFWKSINDLLEESHVESDENKKLLIAAKGQSKWEKASADRRRFLKKIDGWGRIVSLIFAVICLYALLVINPATTIDEPWQWFLLAISPMPVLAFYIVRFFVHRHHLKIDDKEVKTVALESFKNNLDDFNQ